MKMLRPVRKNNCGCSALIEAIDRYIAKADNDLEDQLSEAGFLNIGDSIEGMEALEDTVAAILTDQTDDIVAALKSVSSLEDALEKINQLFEPGSETAQKMTEVFTAYFEEAVPALATEYIQQIEADLSVKQLRARTTAWILSWSEDLSNLMQLSSGNQMGNLLQTAIDNGDSVADLTRKLMEEGIRNEEWQARRAALTEMLRAHDVANHEAIIQSPATSEHSWKHSGAYKIAPRPNHVDMDGQTVPKDEPFTLQGADGNTYHPMHPCDTSLPASESVNCHCFEQGVVDEDVLGMTLEERQALQQAIIDEDDGAWEAELDAANRAKAGIEE